MASPLRVSVTLNWFNTTEDMFKHGIIETFQKARSEMGRAGDKQHDFTLLGPSTLLLVPPFD